MIRRMPNDIMYGGMRGKRKSPLLNYKRESLLLRGFCLRNNELVFLTNYLDMVAY